ncbi:MAG: proton-conducting transporter membrane subunit [Candidatus Omnitrophota bacterium]|nr:proton-conducting transporter membrane subunit [Candidatus Omnitrophota bacterium]
MPSLLILLPLFGVIVLNLPLGNIMRRLAFIFAFGLFLMQIVLAIFHYPGIWTDKLQAVDTFFKVTFAVDHLSFIVILSIGIVSLTSLMVGRYTIADEDKRFNFINLLIIASLGMCGIVMVQDIFSLYVFLEVVAVSAFILIALDREKKALEGAFKYIVMSAIATIMMLSSIALIILVAGDTSFTAVRQALLVSSDAFIVKLAIGLFICGLFVKGGLVPFHGWLPDAYSQAPSAVSVLLAGIVTKVSGIYTLIRLTTAIFGFTGNIKGVLLLVGVISMLFGAFAALTQNNFKRMLAYSSISQVGYILAGLGTGIALGVVGAIFHLFNHAIFKSLLFVNSAAVEKKTGLVDMDTMGGLSEKMPVTGATSLVGFLSTSGIPPFAGFWSKLMIIIALWFSGHYAYAVIAIMASVLTLAYLLTMQRKVFFGKLAGAFSDIKEAEFGFVAVQVVLALITIGVGVFFPIIFNAYLTQFIR